MHDNDDLFSFLVSIHSSKETGLNTIDLIVSYPG